jgi:deoxycytidylate deaminase
MSSSCQATKEAFAAILQDGSVISWGFGGVILQLDQKNVQEVQATDRAFVRILSHGAFLSWGDRIGW